MSEKHGMGRWESGRKKGVKRGRKGSECSTCYFSFDADLSLRPAVRVCRPWSCGGWPTPASTAASVSRPSSLDQEHEGIHPVFEAMERTHQATNEARLVPRQEAVHGEQGVRSDGIRTRGSEDGIPNCAVKVSGSCDRNHDGHGHSSHVFAEYFLAEQKQRREFSRGEGV